MGRIEGRLALLAGLADHVVLFPFRDDPHLYGELRPGFRATPTIVPFRELFTKHDFGGPLALIVANQRIAIIPDIHMKRAERWPVLFVDEDGSNLRSGSLVSKEDVDAMKKDPSLRVLQTKSKSVLEFGNWTVDEERE